MTVCKTLRRTFLTFLIAGASNCAGADEPISALQRAIYQQEAEQDSVQPVQFLSSDSSEPCGEGLDCEAHRIDFTAFMHDATNHQSCDPKRRCFHDWYGESDLIFMSREDDPYGLSFSTLGGTTQPVQLNHGFTPGVRATIGTRTGTTGQFQVSYLGINEWSADNRTSNIPFGGSTLDSDDEYSANLNDLQFNLIGMDPYANWDWLVGLRVIDQRDELSSLLTLDDGLGNPNSVTTELVEASASNTLFGAQLGTRCGRWFGPLAFDGSVKFGVFNNRVSQFGPIFNNAIIIDGMPEPTYDTDDDEVSFLGDFQFRMSYQASGNLALQIGYQGLSFSEIAQSTRQDGSVSSPTNLNYHGLFVGMQWLR